MTRFLAIKYGEVPAAKSGDKPETFYLWQGHSEDPQDAPSLEEAKEEVAYAGVPSRPLEEGEQTKKIEEAKLKNPADYLAPLEPVEPGTYVDLDKYHYHMRERHEGIGIAKPGPINATMDANSVSFESALPPYEEIRKRDNPETKDSNEPGEEEEDSGLG